LRLARQRSEIELEGAGDEASVGREPVALLEEEVGELDREPAHRGRPRGTGDDVGAELPEASFSLAAGETVPVEPRCASRMSRGSSGSTVGAGSGTASVTSSMLALTGWRAHPRRTPVTYGTRPDGGP
jgi:hypothetical protein